MDLKRGFDLAFSGAALIITSPILVLVAAAIYLYDFNNPLYVAPRIGKNGQPFRMVKFRSMMVNADRSGVSSTSANDSRVTPIGGIVRRLKLDELMQLWNVLRGDMSLVGPRPNVPSGVAVYTPVERRLLEMRPGITDFSSIVFADEGEILKGHFDPDAAYDQLIRPWKSRLGIFYVEHAGFGLDLRLIWLTMIGMVSRTRALAGVHSQLARMKAPADLIDVTLRNTPLQPACPPGTDQASTSRARYVRD